MYFKTPGAVFQARGGSLRPDFGQNDQNHEKSKMWFWHWSRPSSSSGLFPEVSLEHMTGLDPVKGWTVPRPNLMADFFRKSHSKSSLEYFKPAAAPSTFVPREELQPRGNTVNPLAAGGTCREFRRPRLASGTLPGSSRRLLENSPR